MSSEIIECKRCKKIFNHIVGEQQYCTKCKKDIDEIIVNVKEYIRENKDCSVSEISEKFKISTNMILRWVKEEILEFTETSDIKISCEKCGKLINTGRYCTSCKKECIDSFNKSISIPKKIEVTKDTTSKMRFLDNNKTK